MLNKTSVNIKSKIMKMKVDIIKKEEAKKIKEKNPFNFKKLTRTVGLGSVNNLEFNNFLMEELNEEIWPTND